MVLIFSVLCFTVPVNNAYMPIYVGTLATLYCTRDNLRRTHNVPLKRGLCDVVMVESFQFLFSPLYSHTANAVDSVH